MVLGTSMDHLGFWLWGFSKKIMTYCPILCVQTSSSYWLWHACATITTSWSIQSIHLQSSIHVDGCNSFSVKARQVIPKWMSHFYKWWNVIKSYMIIVFEFFMVWTQKCVIDYLCNKMHELTFNCKWLHNIFGLLIN